MIGTGPTSQEPPGISRGVPRVRGTDGSRRAGDAAEDAGEYDDPVLIAQGLFWAAGILLLAPLAYPVVPILARVLRLGGRRRAPGPDPSSGGISAVVCFVDEADRLGETIRAFLASRGSFPREVVLVGDRPTAPALEVARDLARRDPRVRLHVGATRRGKAARQWEGVRRARLDLVLLLDANTRVEPEAAGRLGIALSEPGVVYSTGRLLYEGRDQGFEDRYWDLEHQIRLWEDPWLGPLGGSGGLLCCRRRDYTPCAPEAMLDLVVPCLLEAVTGGRGRYVSSARAHEPARGSLAAWRRARVRIQARALGSVGLLRGWLGHRGPGRAVQFLGHKFLRWHASTSLLIALGAALFGYPRSLGTWVPVIAILLGASLLGAILCGREERVSPLLAPGYALLVQLAGLALALAGRVPAAWTPGDAGAMDTEEGPATPASPRPENEDPARPWTPAADSPAAAAGAPRRRASPSSRSS